MNIRDLLLDAADVVDSYFIQSELKDIRMSESEMSERASLDALTSETLTHQGEKSKRRIPLGKRVI